jgi:hypothetical protein
MEYICQGLTKKGEKCKYKAKFGIYCGKHKLKNNDNHKNSKRKFDGLDLPRIPERLKEKLANASDIGIKKIKEQIIQMWLEDGGSYSILHKYGNRIPVAEDVYKILLEEFNGEECVMNQIFFTYIQSQESDKKESDKKESNFFYASSKPPLVPTSLHYYTDFISQDFETRKDKTLTKEEQASFNKLKTFIFKKWTSLGEIIYNNKIYLTKSVYDGAHTYIKNKLKEVSELYDINIDFWSKYIMKNIFAIGKLKIKKEEPSKKRYTLKDIESELTKIFPDKDIKIYIDVISKNTRDYTISSNTDIHKLYREFHPDKCSSDQKVVKLCNLFCGRVENIKKLWQYKKNPNLASPISSKQSEIEIVLKILNEEV